MDQEDRVEIVDPRYFFRAEGMRMSDLPPTPPPAGRGIFRGFRGGDVTMRIMRMAYAINCGSDNYWPTMYASRSKALAVAQQAGLPASSVEEHHVEIVDNKTKLKLPSGIKLDYDNQSESNFVSES